jgi:excisionase family DNA binding protein
VSAERFLTVGQVATELHLSIETVRRYLRAGSLHGVQINRQAGWLVSREELDRFIADLEDRATDNP